MALDLTSAFKAETEITDNSAPAAKRTINPRFPITSLVSGDNQFTAISDSHHGQRGVIDRIAAEIPKMAQAGLKHVILEIPVFPEGHFMLKDPIVNEGHRKIEDILTRMNNVPPQITDIEILEHAYLFSDDHDESGANEIGKAHANLLVKAMQSGVRVHFAGDDKGFRESDLVNETLAKEQKILKENPKLTDLAQSTEDDPDYIKKMKIPEKEKKALTQQVEQLKKRYFDNVDEYERRTADYNEARMGVATETERANRFVELAQGEPALLVFGRRHFNKGVDLNETLDVSLKADALKNGRPVPEKTPVVEIWQSKQVRAQWPEKYGEDLSAQQPPDIRIFANTREVEIPPENQNKYKLSAPPTTLQLDLTP